MAFAYYLIAHSSSFLGSFGLLLLHDNLEDVSSLDNYIFSYFNSFLNRLIIIVYIYYKQKI
jgi:hypothetical protein